MSKDELNIRRVALSLGSLFAILHTAEVLLYTNSDFIKWLSDMHFISWQYTIQPFNMATYITGVIAAFVAGAVIGALFSIIYNKLK